ncbi:SusC/RagA family TonB-linked outer membrane protein [Arcticibacterium luteifluviistationis]|uniref:SusC/RagA family TonB-linked outer membrane protein n=1 Tax=Arcticibacterium luteifluviistationis TaxID=1784714 RepID=A0A2Z4GD51_9BACT|nr:SusC/RagA family TonB-linked outer membrane protein [Arcticibacterium luteifluviistationis]AWV99242.1 SusC/RagA family TonB-linked outer membrane protein [Arcticibacterium luteifluviistationis]
MKRFLQLKGVLALLLCGFITNAQTISGVVSSAEDGALPGVSVAVKGTTVGTISDFEGKFSLNVPSKESILVFSAIAFATQEMPVGNKTTFDVTLVSDNKLLNEVVVTALGITREKKSLGFSQQEISGEALTESRSNNVVNGLSGKVAGVRISSNGGPGSGSNIQIRGSSSVSGNNQPLIVINGVPMQQTTSNTYGGGISEVNPDNIKTMSVLKGPNAAALYGSRAANGVILITTKDGSSTKGIGVEYNANFTVERPFVKPDFQNTYGGGNGYRTWYADGWSGVIQPDAYDQYQAAYGNLVPGSTTGTSGTDESWGAPLDGRLTRQWWTGTDVAPLTPQPDNWEDFWQTGTTLTNSIALSGGNEDGNFRLSYSKLNQKGISAYNDYNRDNFTLSSGYNLTKWLKASFNADYIKTGGNRNYQSGQQFIWAHRDVDWEKISNWSDYVDTHIQKEGDTDPPNWQHTYFTNPFYTNELLPSTNDKDRLLGNISIQASITDDLSLMLRSGTDVWTDTRINISNFERTRNGNTSPGRFSETVFREQENNHDFLLSYDKMFSSDFSFVGQVGGAIRTNYYKYNYTYVGELVVDGIYNLSNGNPSQNTADSEIQESEVQSMYGSFQFGYLNSLFLDLTARNDWSSTLPNGNNSYFYPSASVSAVFTDLWDINSSVLSFGKLRASWAQVGNDADPYQLSQTFSASGSWDGSIPEYSENTEIANAFLKPEITTGIEIGADLRFFKSRLGLDVTYYDQTTKNQILGVEISKASGYNSRILNAGKVNNSGIEISLSGTAYESASGFKWDVLVNYAKNKNKVIELAEGLETYTLQERRGLTSIATIGEPYGTLYGIGFAKSPDGQIIYENGLPQTETTPQILGNIQPDWTGGFMNTFSYKNVTLTALIDARFGGDFFDEGTGTARWTGQYAETAIGREEGVIGEGVMNVGTDENPEYVPNTVMVAGNTLYGYNNPRRYHEAVVFDGTYVKLREMSLGYTFPSTFLEKMKIQNAKLSLVGRNVLMLFSNNPHIDPEVDSYGGNSQGFTYGQLPNSRSLGFNLSLGF